MHTFMHHSEASCQRVDWIGVHWYGGANFAAFRIYMEKTYAVHQ
jgi:hypothetical protein